MTCIELNVSYYRFSVFFFVIRIAPWTQRRTSWSVWRHSERCSAIDLVRQSAHTVWHLASRYEVGRWRVIMAVGLVMTFLSDLYFLSYLLCFSDLTLASNCTTKSWRRCWNRYSSDLIPFIQLFNDHLCVSLDYQINWFFFFKNRQVYHHKQII